MNTQNAIEWLKRRFQKELELGLAGTSYSIDLLVAIAYQETGYLWGPRIEKLSVADLLEICVGDTIDAPSRSAFPKNKAALLAQSNGERMFAVAREALALVKKYDKGYEAAYKNPEKFCHGYGLFQYDLQFFKEDPQFFLQKKWRNFGDCLARFIAELKAAQARQKWTTKKALTDTEQILLAVAYNAGRANPAKGFKQGYFNKGTQRYYGENICEYFRIAQAVKAGAVDKVNPPEPEREPSEELIGAVYLVEIRSGWLNLRSIPKADTSAKVLVRLPDGQSVRWISGAAGDPFLEVEARVDGVIFQGFAASRYLVRVEKAIPLEENVRDAVVSASAVS